MLSRRRILVAAVIAVALFVISGWLWNRAQAPALPSATFPTPTQGGVAYPTPGGASLPVPRGGGVGYPLPSPIPTLPVSYPPPPLGATPYPVPLARTATPAPPPATTLRPLLPVTPSAT